MSSVQAAVAEAAGDPREAPFISVITATFNSIAVIEQLARSLEAQTFRHFDWIVYDGVSSDGTAQFLQNFAKQNTWCQVSVEPDFGIYDALNKGIRASTAGYYLVMGSDDTLMPNALAEFERVAHSTQADVVLAAVEKQGRICSGFYPKRAWLGHQQVFKGSHSVGMLIRRQLHENYGYYSNRFPLLADGFFLKKLLADGKVSFVQADFVAGEFAYGGASTTNRIQSLAETWQIQLLTDKHIYFQTLIFFVKTLIRIFRIR